MSQFLGHKKLATDLACNNTTVYSESMPFETCTGDVAIELTATTASTWTITQQASPDNIKWYDCTDGNEGAVGAVCSTTTTAVSAWIVPTLAPCPYVRFKIVNGTELAGVVNLTLFYSEMP